MCVPVVGHSKHCPFEAYDAPERSKQHSLNDMESLNDRESLNDTESLPSCSPSHLVVLKHTGAVHNNSYITIVQ